VASSAVLAALDAILCFGAILKREKRQGHRKVTMSLKRSVSVREHGAAAGEILSGNGLSNRGLRVRVKQDQPRGHNGPIEGEFVILSVGDNLHSESLKPLLHHVTNAATVLGIIRREHPSCVNVVNTSVLVLGQE
jgi:hypothetical protein